MELTINSKELDKYIAQIQKRNTSMKPLFKEIAVILHRSILKNFSAQGRPQKWAKNTASTLLEKRRHYKSTGLGDVLLRTNQLRSSIGSVREIHENYLEFGTRDEVAPYLQSGRYNYKPMKPRPFIIFQDEDIDKIVARAASHAFGDR